MVVDRPVNISNLISGVDRYNPGNAHLLEDYLRDQLADSTYDLLSNLALLKLYQFNPNLCSPTATLSILFLSLAHAPFSPDFALAWALLSDSFVVGAALPPLPPTSDDEDDIVHAPATPQGEKETAQRLKELSSLLLARKFKSFWSILSQGGQGAEEVKVQKTIQELLKSAVGFEDILRNSIAVEVEASFKGLALTTLESFLGLQADSPLLQPILKSHNWVVDGSVKFPANESNSPASTLQREKIEVQQLSKLLGQNA